MFHVSASSSRKPDGPILAGDILRGRKVAGFAYAEEPMPPTRYNDRLLFEGDQELAKVPTVIVPVDAREADRVGVGPFDRLPPQSRRFADEVSDGLSDRVEALLGRPDASWRGMASALFEALREAQHEVYIAGGAVRDLVAGTGPEVVRDLDLAGTAPPGRFHDVMYDVLKVLGGSESDMRLSPDTLVCWTAPEDPELAETALVEYRSLALSGFRLPGTSSDFADDARHRDLTVNSLYYDRRRAVVVDPTGRGVDDLTGGTRRIVCCRASRKPRETAVVVIRAIRLVLRWEDEGVSARLDDLRRWAEELPAGHWEGLPGLLWKSIRDDHREYLSGAGAARQLQTARLIGVEAAALIGKLLGVRS
ncbi:hypothetical protein MED01_003104 [Micromonospora sp. MED01]|uniref:hypothetical protein n=1 Tax=Micromonospora alfalfae TaxID=2911212 RepID=UPI001EE79712|nr:hypothetical protein [Micromonospora alfalfae]MCG5464847.1 hypothetical protein [Micromonospora alfalfae]